MFETAHWCRSRCERDRNSKTLNHDGMKEIEEDREGRALIPHTVPSGSPILHVAVYEGFDKCVNELLETGADVNIVPRRAAMCKGYPKCVAALVAAGADVNIKSITRSSAIDCAITRGDPEILKLILMANVAENGLTAALNRASRRHNSNKSHISVLESQLRIKMQPTAYLRQVKKHCSKGKFAES